MEMVPGSSPGTSHAAPAQLQRPGGVTNRRWSHEPQVAHQSTFLTLKDVQSRNCVNILTKGINVAAIANCNLVTENNRNRAGGQKFKAKVGPSSP